MPPQSVFEIGSTSGSDTILSDTTVLRSRTSQTRSAAEGELTDGNQAAVVVLPAPETRTKNKGLIFDAKMAARLVEIKENTLIPSQTVLNIEIEGIRSTGFVQQVDSKYEVGITREDDIPDNVMVCFDLIGIQRESLKVVYHDSGMLGVAQTSPVTSAVHWEEPNPLISIHPSINSNF